MTKQDEEMQTKGWISHFVLEIFENIILVLIMKNSFLICWDLNRIIKK